VIINCAPAKTSSNQSLTILKKQIINFEKSSKNENYLNFFLQLAIPFAGG
jgi:hypothetical protein